MVVSQVMKLVSQGNISQGEKYWSGREILAREENIGHIGKYWPGCEILAGQYNFTRQ